jgi:hypothetical protein
MREPRDMSLQMPIQPGANEDRGRGLGAEAIGGLIVGRPMVSLDRVKPALTGRHAQPPKTPHVKRLLGLAW